MEVNQFKKNFKYSTFKKLINESLVSNKKIKNLNYDIHVVVFKNNENNDIILISSDLIWFSEDLTNDIKNILFNQFSFKKNNVLLSATHNHNSIQTDKNFLIGEFDEDFYFSFIENLISCVENAIKNRTENLNIYFNKTELNKKYFVNRRLNTWTLKSNDRIRRAQNRPNRSKKISNTLNTIIFKNKNNELQLIIIILTGHPTSDISNFFSRDYPGILKDELERKYQKAKVMFLQGFCGDISLDFIRKPKTIKDYLIHYLIGPSFDKPKDSDLLNWSKSLLQRIYSSINNSKYIKTSEAKIFNIIGDTRLESNKKINIKYFLLSLSKKLNILFVNAEMLNSFDFQNKDNIISVGYTNGMIGYIAPKNEYKYGGYEIDGFIKRFNLKSRINDKIEEDYKTLRKYFSSIIPTRKIKFNQARHLSYDIKYLPYDYDINIIKKLLEIILLNDQKKIIEFINEMNGSFSIIFDGQDNSYGIVDRIRSYPIFYNKVSLTFNIFDLIDDYNFNNYNELSISEFIQSGFCCQNRTLFNNIYQIESGNLFNLNKFDNLRYFYYAPKFNNESRKKNKNFNDLSNELNDISNKIFNRLKKKYNNKKIFIPLSGGLDSRFVLCKLHEVGIKNIEVFSYGDLKNDESNKAELIAKKLNLKYHFVNLSDKKFKKLFYSKKRLEYWKYSSQYSSLPNMQEFFAIYELMGKNIIKQHDVIINGQAGDFTTGAHIRKELLASDININKVYEIIYEKHFSLWLDYSSNTKQSIIAGISNFLLKNKKYLVNLELFHYYISWEWSERQSKFVTNQQRIYDYYNLNWYLPLWDKEFIEFWKERGLLELKNQNLYKLFLKNWNYENLFDESFNKSINPWIGYKKINILIAKLIQSILGNRYKEIFYKKIKYFNHYHYHYLSYSYLHYLKRSKEIRNHISLHIETYITENMQWLKKFDKYK